MFAVFDAQDSGNISYGVRVSSERFFVKTAGRPDDPRPFLQYEERVMLLRNAVLLSRSCSHPAMPTLNNAIESPEGPMLVYEWLDGELIGVPRPLRDDPESSFQRFRAQPTAKLLRCLDIIYELHDLLARSGWIACDFYDGCLIYNFATERLGIVDLDHYHRGPFENRMGRMFGSSRFMAPEEFELGAQIDERTTVFTMGRTALLFLSDGSRDAGPFRGTGPLFEVAVRACESNPLDRYESVSAFYEAWRAAQLEA